MLAEHQTAPYLLIKFAWQHAIHVHLLGAQVKLLVKNIYVSDVDAFLTSCFFQRRVVERMEHPDDVFLSLEK